MTAPINAELERARDVWSKRDEAQVTIITELRAYITNMKADHDAYRNSAAAAEIVLSARIDELEAVLKPFANFCDIGEEIGVVSKPEDEDLAWRGEWFRHDACVLLLSDFRRARAALQPKDEAKS